jgi:predicted CXXCH cytochrome family protein
MRTAAGPRGRAVALVIAAALGALGLARNGAGAPNDTHYNKSCTASDCHPTPPRQPGAIDHPAFLEQWCDRCHGDHTPDSRTPITKPQPQVCLACHTGIELAGDHVAHPPGAQSCTSCHEPHRGTVRNLLRTEQHLTACATCHADDLARAAQRPYRHGHFDPAGECGSCHHAHQGAGTGYIRANLGETCLTCHDMAIQSHGRRLENVGREIRELAVVHPPLREALCHACHTPHGSMQPSLLKDNYPTGAYDTYRRENYGMCWQCHEPSLVEAHPAGVATRFRNGRDNLHRVHVLQLKRGRACHVCHTAHATDTPHLIRSSITFGAWEGELRFEVTETGGRCATPCHRERAYRR